MGLYTIMENGICRDYSGHIKDILGLYRDNGKENGNYRDYRGNIGDIVGLYGLNAS